MGFLYSIGILNFTRIFKFRRVLNFWLDKNFNYFISPTFFIFLLLLLSTLSSSNEFINANKYFVNFTKVVLKIKNSNSAILIKL